MNHNPGIHFHCKKGCSNCCSISGGYVFLNEREARNIAEHLAMDYNNFEEFFIKEIEDQLALVDGENEACVFLEEGRCMIYEQRPQQCRTFPFWKENMETEKRWKLTQKICPGIGRGRFFSGEEIREILSGKTLDSER